MGKGAAEATLFYRTFTAKIRWEIAGNAKLILSADTDRTITSSFPITDDKYMSGDQPYAIRYLNGFSPYTQDNKAETIKAAVFDWKKKLEIEFAG